MQLASLVTNSLAYCACGAGIPTDAGGDDVSGLSWDLRYNRSGPGLLFLRWLHQ